MEEIAEVYARSLWEVADEHSTTDAVREQLGQFAQALDESADLRTFFFSPYLSTEEKKAGLKSLLEDVDGSLLNFLELLVEKHRMPAVFRVRRTFDALWREENKLLPVQVTSAVALDESTVSELGERIGEKTGRKVDLTAIVDPDILGGLVLRVGNSILDASIRTRLDSLRRQVAR